MQAFQVLTNFILMPMFFLSGALFPLVNSPQWMKFLAQLNPLSYGVDLMRTTVLGNSDLSMFPMYINILVVIGVVTVMTFIGILLFKKQD